MLASMTTKWYYVTPQKTHQEFSDADVPDLLSSRTIGLETLIWNATMADWKPAGEVKPEWFTDQPTTVSTTTPDLAAGSADSVAANVPASVSPGSGIPGTTSAPPLMSNGAADPMALASLVCGIVAIVMVAAGCAIFPCLGFLGLAVAIPGVVTGHMALGNIKRGSASEEGKGLAIAGLVMSYATLALLVIGLLLAILGVGIFALAGSGIPDQL